MVVLSKDDLMALVAGESITKAHPFGGKPIQIIADHGEAKEFLKELGAEVQALLKKRKDEHG